MLLRVGCDFTARTIICAVLVSYYVDANHFAGGIFMWAPTGNGTEIEIEFRLSWNRTRHPCDDRTITSGGLIGEGTFKCFTSCEISQNLVVHCTDFSETDVWSSGRNNFTYSPSATQLSFGFVGGDWISLVSGGGHWSIKTYADVSLRQDTNRINSSPTVEMSPVVALQHGCQHKIILPVFDADGDVIRCRFAAGFEECGGVCGAFPANLSSTSCSMEYTANGAIGWYAVAVQIEDFLSVKSTTRLSSVSLQFLVKVFSSNGSCGSVPVFVSPTPVAETCFPMNANDNFSFNIVAFTNSPASIKSIDTVKNGPSTNSSQFSNITGSYMRLDVTWTPTLSYTGNHAMCFSAVDNNGLRSEQRCVYLYVEAKPKLVDVRKTEHGSFIEWELIYDKRVERPDNSAYIIIYDASGAAHDILDATSDNVTFSGPYIRFWFNVNLAKSYYILLSMGVVLGGCKIPSDPMENKTRIIINRKECPKAQTISHGTWGENNTVYGDQANITCDRGYQLSGNATLVCGANETWQGQQPSCTIIDCGTLQDIRNGSVTFNSTVYVETAKYICDKGFHIDDASLITRECTEFGSWRGETPYCVIQDCRMPSEVEFSTFTYNGTTYQESVNYTCNDNYFLSTGNDVRRCEADGHWSGTVPTCTRKFIPGDNCLPDLTGISQCLGAEFSCRFDTFTGNFRCLCSPELILFNFADKALCLEKSDYGGSCHIEKQCTTFLSECIRTGMEPGSCGCPWGTSYNETVNECTTNAKVFCSAGPDRLGLWWNKTKLLTTAYQQCPAGSSGKIIRKCLIDGTFSSALYNCTKHIFKNLTEKIHSTNITTTEALESLQEAVKNNSELYPGDVDYIENILTQIADKEVNGTFSAKHLKQNAETFFEIADILTDPELNRPVWECKVEQNNKGVGRFIETIDRYSLNLAKIIDSSNETKLTIQKENLVVSIWKVSEDLDIDLKYPDEDDSRPLNLSLFSSFTVRSESLAGIPDKVTSVVVVVYRDIAKALPKTDVQQTYQSSVRTINSQVLSIQLLPKPPKVLNPPIQLTFSIHEQKEGFESQCSFWQTSADGTICGWSTSGCERSMANATTVQCSCSHLTNFAILTSPIETPTEHQATLTVISLTGCGISIGCLVITLILHVSYWGFLKGDRNVLAMTLCACLLVAYVLFVFGVTRTSVKGVCTSVAVLLHYTFLLVFFLLLAEGIYMAVQVVLPFHKKSHLKELLIGAFAIPAVFVLIVASATELHGYGNNKYCWLTVDSVAFWMFVGPALLITIFNLATIFLIIKKMCGSKWLTDMNKREQAKIVASKTTVMLPVIGVTWLFGILSLHESAIALQYLFVIFNSFQGLFIFLFHCVLNKQLRTAIAKSCQQFSTLSEETLRNRGITDHSASHTTVTHIVRASTITHDLEMAAIPPRRSTIEDDRPSLAFREQYKMRHATPSQTHVGENKPGPPRTQVFIEGSRDRLRNMTYALRSRTSKTYNVAKQDTTIFPKNLDKQSLHKQPQDDKVTIINNEVEVVEENVVAGAGFEAENIVMVSINHEVDSKEDSKARNEDRSTEECIEEREESNNPKESQV